MDNRAMHGFQPIFRVARTTRAGKCLSTRTRFSDDGDDFALIFHFIPSLDSGIAFERVRLCSLLIGGVPMKAYSGPGN